MPDTPEETEFRPERMPRRGELFAWISAGIALVAWIVFLVNRTLVPVWLPVVAILLLITAGLIRLTNWMDTRTLIRLLVDGIEYEDGLRRVVLRWENIERLEVFPSSWGEKVYVVGKQRRFSFRTLGEVKLNGEVKGKIGFQDGEKLMSFIIQKCNLKPSETPHNGGYYYSRK